MFLVFFFGAIRDMIIQGVIVDIYLVYQWFALVG